MKTLILSLFTLISFSSFAASNLYKCNNVKNDEVSYLKMANPIFGKDSLRWSLNDDVFDDSDDKLFLDTSFSKGEFSCVEKSVNVIVYKSRTMICYTDSILNGEDQGKVLYYYTSGGDAGSWSRSDEYTCLLR